MTKQVVLAIQGEPYTGIFKNWNLCYGFKYYTIAKCKLHVQNSPTFSLLYFAELLCVKITRLENLQPFLAPPLKHNHCQTEKKQGKFHIEQIAETIDHGNLRSIFMSLDKNDVGRGVNSLLETLCARQVLQSVVSSKEKVH